jgi:hypothetical protein
MKNIAGMWRKTYPSLLTNKKIFPDKLSQVFWCWFRAGARPLLALSGLPIRPHWAYAPSSARAGADLRSLGSRVKLAPDTAQGHGIYGATEAAGTSSVLTLKLASLHGPNSVTIATSVASRPRAIRMRPMRGLL